MKYVVLLIACLVVISVVNACHEDISNQFLRSESSIVDTARATIVLETLNDEDKEAIFNFARFLRIEVEGFLEPKQFVLPITSIANRNITQSFRVFDNKKYSVKQAILLDQNKSVIAVCPLNTSVWAPLVTTALPQTFQSIESKNVNIFLDFLPSAGASLELTGYDLSSNVNTLPFLNFELQVRDASDFNRFITSSLTVSKKSNNAVILTKTRENDGRFPVRLYYYSEDEAFVFEVEGFTKEGYKKITETRTAKFLLDAYDRTTRNEPFQIKL